ncbi:MAG: hypothetical protein ACRDD1_18145 [Planctomycetia bacterium]
MPSPPTKRAPDLDPGERFYATLTAVDEDGDPVSLTGQTVALLFDHAQLGTRAILKSGDAYTANNGTSVTFDAPPAWTAALEPGEYQLRLRIGGSTVADRLGGVLLMTLTSPPAGRINRDL